MFLYRGGLTAKSIPVQILKIQVVIRGVLLYNIYYDYHKILFLVHGM